jgi:glycosyltransferase involved in cell wall biosynthesis
MLSELEEREGPFDVVHDNQTLSYGVAMMAAARPVVANVHHPLDVDVKNGLRSVRSVGERVKRLAWYPWRMQQVTARRLDGLISGSKASARLVEELWRLPPGRMHAIYDGVDIERFHMPAHDETQPGTLLFVGNSEDYNKGIVHLLRAMALLPRSLSAHLYLVGGPSAAPVIAPREIARLGIGDRVTIVGRVSEADLAAWYRRAQVLVSPSLYEGFGLPAAEAMACGTPVIASDGGALPEVVADGVTGMITPAGDAAALAGAIESLLADQARCREMGEAGHRRVLDLFTWPRTAAETVTVYDAVIAARHGFQSARGDEYPLGNTRE